MTASMGLNAAISLFDYLAKSCQTPGLSPTSTPSSAPNSTGTTGSAAGQDSASVSSPGQFLGELQQLQSQSPAGFKQVTSQIASQLQTAAQQTTGHAREYLSNLASEFHAVSSSGNLNPLLSSRNPTGQGTYNQAGQLNGPGSGTGSIGGRLTAGNGNLQQLFANLTSQVTQTLASIPTHPTSNHPGVGSSTGV